MGNARLMAATALSLTVLIPCSIAAPQTREPYRDSGSRFPAELTSRTGGSHASRAIRAVYAGRYDEAIRDFEKAIEANPGDAGADYDPWPTKDLSPEALEHGELMVRKMVTDRPAMSRWLDPRDVIWKWTRERFAGIDLDESIDWDARPPTADAHATHTPPSQGRRGSIRVRKEYLSGIGQGRERYCEALLANVVFELHNISNAKQFNAAFAEARRGTLTKDEFVVRIFRSELRAMQQTRAFYVWVFLPWAKENGVVSEPRDWFATVWGSADEVLELYKSHSDYPGKPYGDYYDYLRNAGPEASERN